MPLRVRAGRFWEDWYPWILGAIGGLAVYFWNPTGAKVYNALDKSLNSAVGAAAVLAGFQGTALSLLLTLLNMPPIKELRKLKLYRPLIRFHAHAIGALLVCVAYSVVLLGIMGMHLSFGNWSRAVAVTTALIAVASSLAAFRVAHLMVKLLARHGDALSDSK